ncbi:MAG TPA: glycosyltransferase [Cyclobacteriaceae bacterium]|nr:glycosyltransferase [Cyclobacteriaceae bacterium]
MRNFFVYPKPDKIIGSPNPYITNLIKALSRHHRVVNANAKNRGVFNLFRFLFQTDVYVLNWIENLTEKRMGKLQAVAFVCFMGCAKLLRKKILWILHNKYSHHRKEDPWIDFLFRFMMKYADKIITHSHSGLEFVQGHFPEAAHKVEVIYHPVDISVYKDKPSAPEYDFLIWGSIYPYKGIDKFLGYLKNNPPSHPYRILLVGKCFNQQYKETLTGLLTENVTFYDELLGMDKIAEFSGRARFTLFTYQSKTVISSGSLMDAISMGAVIIGPNHGSFRDLSQFGFVKTYDSYEDIFEIHREHVLNPEPYDSERDRFLSENSWEGFVEKLIEAL